MEPNTTYLANSLIAAWWIIHLDRMGMGWIVEAGKEKNPQFVEQVSALYAKDQNLILVINT